jgi:hypothetical protein
MISSQAIRMFISEPTTTLTDYAMALQSVIHAVTLRRAIIAADTTPAPAARLYLAGFTMAAWASFAGGTSHGFRPQMGESVWGLVWTFTVIAIVTAFVLLIAGGARSAMSPTVADPARRRSGRRWLIVGFGVTAVGLTLLVQKVSFHQHFNHNDLYHVVQMVGLYGVYRGGRRLLDLDPA